MDFDSSAKFISSLAKFLQSLCNGYVEFDNGVEVIGHIYLNVDTGKKIDYVLNEKVCKTDENSVTFISNSFHAQPAERPKPEEKPKQSVPAEQDADSLILLDDSDTGYDQYSDNVQHNNSTAHLKSKRASKRPYSHSFSSNRPSPKTPKFDSSSSHPNGAHLPSNNSLNDSSFNLNVSGNITAASESDLSHLSQVFPESVNDSTHVQDSDIKPVLDKELNVIKKEYDPSAEGPGDGNTYDEHGDDSYYSQDQSYEHGNDQYYGGGHQDPSQRLDYDPSKMFMGESGRSSNPGDAQESGRRWADHDADPMRGARRVEGGLWQCVICLKTFRRKNHFQGHMNTHHYGTRPFHCDLCSKSFAHENSLIYHKKRYHNWLFS